MHFEFAILVSSILGLAAAMPRYQGPSIPIDFTIDPPKPPPPPPVKHTVCSGAFFFDRTTEGSPSISDCQALPANLALMAHDGYAYRWHLPPSNKDPTILLDAYRCRLGIRSVTTAEERDVIIGEQDVINIVNTMIEKYGRDGKVGSEGAMMCGGKAVWFGLYKRSPW